MTPTKQLDRDLIAHACSQLNMKARQHVRDGMTPASAANAAIRETKSLFPPDWRLAVQGGDEEDEVEVWEVEHKMYTACARVVRKTEEDARAHLVKAVKDRARTEADPAIRRVARWSNEKVLDILHVAMPRDEYEAFRAVRDAVSRMHKHTPSKKKRS